MYINNTDSSLYYCKCGSIHDFCLLYIDNLLLTGNDTGFLFSTIQSLQIKFPFKDLGPLSYFLSI